MRLKQLLVNYLLPKREEMCPYEIETLALLDLLAKLHPQNMPEIERLRYLFAAHRILSNFDVKHLHDCCGKTKEDKKKQLKDVRAQYKILGIKET
jgi:hypothetical protein